VKTKTNLSVGVDARYLVAAGLWLAQQGLVPQGRAAILRLSTELLAQRFLHTYQISLEDAWAILDRVWPLHSYKGNEAFFWRPTEDRLKEVLAAFERLKERPGEGGEHEEGHQSQPDEDGQSRLAKETWPDEGGMSLRVEETQPGETQPGEDGQLSLAGGEEE